LFPDQFLTFLFVPEINR